MIKCVLFVFLLLLASCTTTDLSFDNCTLICRKTYQSFLDSTLNTTYQEDYRACAHKCEEKYFGAKDE